MTPELAKKILETKPNAELLELFRMIYTNYNEQAIADTIAYIRAEITMEKQAQELDDAIALLVAEKQALE